MKAAPLLLTPFAFGPRVSRGDPGARISDGRGRRAPRRRAAWFRGAPPPRHWTSSRRPRARDLNQTLGAGAYKRVIEVVDRPELLVKTRAHAALHKQALDHAVAGGAVEVLRAKVARGRRIARALYGGWIDQERVYYVVQRVSAPPWRRTARKGPAALRPESVAVWLKPCQDAPVEAARALLEELPARFTDAGYHMEDLAASRSSQNDAGR